MQHNSRDDATVTARYEVGPRPEATLLHAEQSLTLPSAPCMVPLQWVN